MPKTKFAAEQEIFQTICNLADASECRQRARNLVEAPLTTDAEKRVLRFVLGEEGE